MADPTQDTLPATPPRGRIAGLDAARAIAVMAMVFGHTMDAVLSDAARQVPWVRTYWQFRSFTAPLFLFVSGWVLLAAVPRMHLSGWPVLRRFLPRVAVLFGLGYLVRLPIWDLGGLFRLDATLWSYFATFDALQCIAAALLTALVLCAATTSRLKRACVLVALASVAVLGAGPVWGALRGGTPPSVLAQTFGGGTSLFSIFPWTGYFFIGAALSTLLMPLGNRWLRTALLLVPAAVLLFVLPGPRLQFSDHDLFKFFWRLGPVLVLVALALLLPQRIASWLAPIGRVSLWVYVVHLPIAYGWGYWPGLSIRVGHILSDVEACLLALGVDAVSICIALLASRFVSLRKWKVLWSSLRSREPAVVPASLPRDETSPPAPALAPRISTVD